MTNSYLDVTQTQGIHYFSQKIVGEVVMLNLLRFRDIADYSSFPDLKPETPITGREAYQKYIEHTLPYLKASGGDVIFEGNGGKYLIGPESEQWDMVVLVRQKSAADFLSFSSNKDYLKGIGHRTAALIDSRLLPMTYA